MSPAVNLKAAGCAALLFCTVGGTLFAEASKSPDGSFPYNSFKIPCVVEALKLSISMVLLSFAKISGKAGAVSFSARRFLLFSLPALCYFVSNNCALFIVRELGPTIYQITCNLKVFATGILMRVFLGRRLTWLRWKALVLLVMGTIVTQLETDGLGASKSGTVGYFFVILNSFAAGAGGVLSEKLLKGGTCEDSIHWQNMQLYFFGLLYGLVMSLAFPGEAGSGFFSGFNVWAYACVAAFALGGIIVSFILKYMDNFAKCFVAALAIISVSVVQSIIQHELPQLKVVIGMTLTCMALEQYNLNHQDD